MSKVLIVATSRKTKGGITSVLKAHETGEQWEKYHCHWVQTHRDGPVWRKMIYFVTGMIDFLIRVPFYDIVHIHTADYGTEKRKRIFARLTKLFGKNLIVHLHSSAPEYSIGGMYRNLYGYSFANADRIILLSNTWLSEAKRAFPKQIEKMEVLYNPCPVVSPSLPEDRELYILFAGTLTHRKGYDDLIRAFAGIAHQHPGWRLKFAGNGAIEMGKELVGQLGISDRVDFLGWITGRQKDNAFSHASIYCLPSYSEGFPMGVLDAWAYHLPVVTTPVGGIPDIANDGENLLLFEPGNINQLSEKLDMLMSDNTLCKRLSSESARLASEKFSVETITNHLDNIYRTIKC